MPAVLVRNPDEGPIGNPHMARLIILTGAHKGEELELQRQSNILGRAEGNDFTLNDPTVSSRHCEVFVDEHVVRVRDLDSTNGTFIDNARIRNAEIRSNQVLMLGSMEMRLMDAPSLVVAIPTLSNPEEPPVPTLLQNGTAACLNHPGIAALHKCGHCGKCFCEACVRELHLVGGSSRVFCPVCSGGCVPLAPTRPRRKKSFASRFLETIRIPFRRGDTKE